MCQCETIEELNKMETFFITTYKSYCPEYGYNLTKGGDGGDTYTNNPHIEEIRKKLTGVNNHMFGKHHTADTLLKMKIPKTEDHKIKMREVTLKRLKEKGHPMIGRKHTKETIQKMKNSCRDLKGENNPMYGRKHKENSKKKMGPNRKTGDIKNGKG